MGCFSTILFLIGFVLVMVTFIRWFEQTADAVDNGWWNKVLVLLLMPFAVWLYPSRVSAGRSSPVPLHEPVRGFGSMPKSGQTSGATSSPTDVGPPAEQPPPGTPREFLGMPKVGPAKPRRAGTVEPDQIAKLKQKMREQGMLPPEE